MKTGVVVGKIAMKSKNFLAAVLVLALAGCGTTGDAGSGAQATVTPQAVQETAYTGDGGKGKSLTILPPKATGLAADQDYLPGVVQGELVSNFSGYSAISVLDREKLDAVYDELFSGYYDENAEASWDLGRLAPTEYLMGGSITKTASGYALQLQITRTADKMTAASYSGSCTFAELDNLSAVRRAALDLLQKMGVQPTARTLAELGAAATANQAAAQVALSKGIEAMKQGTVVEALSYYYEAASFDSSLLEAANRASVTSAAISSGNIGENVRNDIQRRKEWLKILTEAEEFFGKHLPYEIVYDPTLTQGKVNYEKETVDMSFKMTVKPTNDFQIVQTILDGLNKTGKKTEWGLDFWPMTSSSFVDARVDSHRAGGYYPAVPGAQGYGVVEADFTGDNRDYEKAILVIAALMNNQGKALATAEKVFFESLDVREGQSTRAHGGQKIRLNYTDYNRGGNMYYYVMEAINKPTVFTNVNANDITNNLTVQIVSVNGIDAATIAKTGYIKISTGEVGK